MTIRSRLLASLVLCAAALAACDGASSTDPAVVPLAPATYVATRLEVVEDGSTTDLLDEGFSIRLELKEDGTTTGSFHMAYAEYPGDPPADVPLAGRWRVEARGDESVVLFDQPDADTFLRDTPFTYSDGRLVGSFGPLHAELRRQ